MQQRLTDGISLSMGSSGLHNAKESKQAGTN
jgi:hypothetical protein